MSDLDEDYRRLSDLDASRPSESVRRAVLDHARHMAELRTTQEHPTFDERPTAQGPPTYIGSRRTVALAKNTRWRPAAFGMLAAAALAGILVAPRFLVPSSTPARVAPAASTSAAVKDQAVAPTEALAPRPPSVATPETGALTGPAAAPRAEAPAPAAPQALAKSRLAAGLDADGHTPLMLAVLSGNAPQVDALLARGADPNTVDADGTTPLQAAVSNSQSAIAAALRRAGARGARGARSTEPAPIPN